MPLIKSGSKKALKENIESEMHAHPGAKHRSQDLAVAYAVQKKAKGSRKKMAEGGMASKNDSARTENRPMPEEVANDSMVVSHNKGMKAAKNDSWTDRSTVAQAYKPSLTKLSQPKMMGSDAFSVRSRDEADKDLMRMNSMPPDGYGKQPTKMYDEEEATKSGDEVSDMEHEHSNGRKPYAKGGMINDDVSMKDAEEDEVEHPAGLESDDDEMSPAKDEYMAGHFAEGGMAHEMDDQPTDEAIEEHEDSLIAAIMAKRASKAMRMDSGSPDEDAAEASHLYMGGQVEGSDESMVDIDENAEEQPNAYYGRNQAALKENYDSDMDSVSEPKDSNEHSDSIDSDDHDMVSSIRRKMKPSRLTR